MFAAVAVTLLLTACGGNSEQIHLLAASSLTDVAAEIEEAFEDTHPTTDLVVNSAASNTLVQQINGGADVDVFLPASRLVLEQLDQPGIDLGTIAINELVLAVPTGNPGGVQALDDLAKSELAIAVCAPDVPCGAATAELPVEINADTMEANVRQVAAKITAGEVDAGVIYRSDLLAIEGLEPIPIEAEAVRVEVPVIVFADASSPLLDFLQQPATLELFREFGYEVPT